MVAISSLKHYPLVGVFRDDAHLMDFYKNNAFLWILVDSRLVFKA